MTNSRHEFRPTAVRATGPPDDQALARIMRQHFIDLVDEHLVAFHEIDYGIRCEDDPQDPSKPVRLHRKNTLSHELVLRKLFLAADGASQSIIMPHVASGIGPAQEIMAGRYYRYGTWKNALNALTYAPAYSEGDPDGEARAYNLAADGGRYRSAYWRMRAALRTEDGEEVNELRGGIAYAAQLATGQVVLKTSREYSAAHPDLEVRRLIAATFLL